MKLQRLLLALLLCMGFSASAQSVQVTGTVKDVKGYAIPGVTIKVQGSPAGATTDEKGNFSLQCPADAVLVISAIGMEGREVRLSGNTRLQLTLHESKTDLDELVVIGYGTQKKKEVTGAIKSIKTDDIERNVGSTLTSSLQGLSSGMQVQQSSFRPGGGASILIRGAGSINASNSPLFVIDGIPMLGGLEDIHPGDIASVEVLKDASATAIYGSRGANGVVLVTTRRGRAGDVRINLKGSSGLQQMVNKQKMMNAQQYADIMEKVGVQLDQFEKKMVQEGKSTDWQNEITQTGKVDDYSLSIASGSDKVKYFTSLSYFNQDGVIVNSDFSRISARVNLDARVNDKLKVGVNMNYIDSRSNRAQTEAGDYGLISSAISAKPTAPVFETPGKYYDRLANNKVNPVAMAHLLQQEYFKNRMLGGMNLEWTVIPDLTFRTDLSTDINSYKINYYSPTNLGGNYTKEGHARIYQNRSRFWQWENTLTYDKRYGRHGLKVMGGVTASSQAFEEAGAEGKGFSNDIVKWNSLGDARNFGPNSSAYAASSLASYLARVNYSYHDRYYVTLSLRADGSSRLAKDNQWSAFPTAAVGWNIDQENFLKGSAVVSALKLRTSYGKTGNQEIGEYASLARLYSNSATSYVFGNQKVVGYAEGSIANPDLKWETSRQFDAGLDVGLFKDRIHLTVDYYHKSTKDLLWNVPLPLSTGFGSSLQNVGRVDNAGIETEISALLYQRSHFRWTAGGNFTYNRNKVVELYEGKDNIGAGLFIGQPARVWRVAKYDGIWQQKDVDEAAKYGKMPGDRRQVDLKEDGVLNDDDNYIAGVQTPKWFGSFNNTLGLGNWQLTAFFTFAGGHKIYNRYKEDGSYYNGVANMYADFYDNYWTPERPSNTYPRITAGRANSGGGGDVHLEDATYLRLRNLQLAYSLPSQWMQRIRVRNIRLYATVQNLFTLTKFTGFDVEGSNYVDQYPSGRSYVVGFDINF